jgi:outer membrane autotransporter protein
LTTEYYKIILKPENFSTTGSTVWRKAGENEKFDADTVAVYLPNKQTEYFKYDNVRPAGRKVYDIRQSSLSGEVDADFVGSVANVSGGAVYNNGTIDKITGDFVANSTTGGYGGAVYNGGRIENVAGNFIGNQSGQDGGTFYNAGTVGSIGGNFLGNHVSRYGGAVYNDDRDQIDNISGNFVGNYAGSGGAIFNRGNIGGISGDFIGNYVSGGTFAYGGAVYNDGNSQTVSRVIDHIRGDFIGNYVAGGYNVAGGAVFNYNNAFIGSITGNFLNNYSRAAGAGNVALGGAVYTAKKMTFAAGEQKTYFMSGNYTLGRSYNKRYNAIFVETGAPGEVPVVTFDTAGGGAWVINDNIEGGKNSNNVINYATRYNLAFTGDGVLNENGLTDQYISINNDIINAGEVTVEGTTLRFGAYQHEDKTANNWDGHGRFVASLNKDGTVNLDAEAVTSLSLNNAAFDLYNKYQDTVNLKGWKASGNSFLHVDVDVENLTADMLNVNGNVEGTTKLVLYPNSDKDIRGESILFAQSTNDTTGNADSFKVWRVYRSPYMFDVKHTPTGKNANQWELEMGNQVNPDADQKPDERPDPEVPDIKPTPTPDKPTNPVYGEVVAYGALPAAALEQTRSVVDNVSGQAAGRRSYCPGCGFYDYYWNGEAFRNLWVNPTYYTSNIDAPFDVDADIWGIEAGGDLQYDLNNKIGIFVSYRQGNYDMNGDGERYYSTVGSEIDIDSYLAGLYYRYDRNNWYAFATLYGGTQQADIKTDDGVKSDTDGVEFGASLAAGYDYNLTDTVYLTPSLGVFYTQVNYDDATDSVGKKAEYNDLRQIELEAGVKLTKAFRLDEGYASVYIKPSVVQTIVDGDEVNITGLGKTNTLDDETLGRIELGGRYGFTDQLSAYGWANYTFGSDYDATTVGLGLNYAF